MTVERGQPSSLEDVEDALLEALQTDVTIASYVRTINSWQGSIEDAVKQSALRDPAILVLFVGGPIRQVGGHHACLCQWQVLVRDRNLRREGARRTGVGAAPGTYNMVADVLRVVTGFGAELDGVKSFEPVSVDLLQAGRDPSQVTSAYLVAFETELDLLVLAGTTDLDQVNVELPVVNRDESTGDENLVPALALTVDLESA